MSRLAEVTLYQHLVDEESLRYIVTEGIEPDILPTYELREVLAWAQNYYMASGLTTAPSVEAIREEFGDLLDDNEIALEIEPEDTVQWAVWKLKSTYAYTQGGLLVKKMMAALAEPPALNEKGEGLNEHAGRIEVLTRYAGELNGIVHSLESRVHRVEAQEGIDEALRLYEGRAASDQPIRGLRFGFPAIDEHTHGLHPGELGIIAAGPKVGKSYFADRVALMEWMLGRATCLFTLENSIQMTYDRIACLAAQVNPTSWQAGRCTTDEVDRVRKWADYMKSEATAPLWVLQPPMGRQDFGAMVVEARVRECESLIIDQLTFVELDSTSHKPKTERIGEGLHLLKKMITGPKPISTLLLHQINRDGVKAADKVGHHEMHHMADSAEVERTADWVWALYASRDDVHARQLLFQTLASRRSLLKHWKLRWDLANGVFTTGMEVTLT